MLSGSALLRVNGAASLPLTRSVWEIFLPTVATYLLIGGDLTVGVSPYYCRVFIFINNLEVNVVMIYI